MTERLENEPCSTLQPFHHFAYVTAHSPTFASLYPTSQLMLQLFRNFTNVTTHSPTIPSLYLRSQLILQPFRCFTYVTAQSPILLSLLLRHRLFTYVTWRAAHGFPNVKEYTLIHDTDCNVRFKDKERYSFKTKFKVARLGCSIWSEGSATGLQGLIT